MEFAESLTAGPHARLAALTGRWAGTATLWFEPGDPHSVEEITLHAEPLAGGRSMRVTYDSGELLLAYHLDDAAWQGAWIDALHTGTQLMWLEGAAATDDDPLLRGSYPAGPDALRWGWNVSFTVDGDELLIAHDNVEPEADPVRALEWRCRRVSTG